MTVFWIAAVGLALLAWLMLSTAVVGTTRASATPSRSMRLWLGVGIPLFAFGMYGFLGNLDALRISAISRISQLPTPGLTDPPTEEVQSMLDSMVGRMKSQEAGTVDAAGWTMVARSYASIQRYESANRAYELAIKLAPGDAQLRAEQAQVERALQGSNEAGGFAGLVTGTVSIAPELANRINPTDTIFVFAREVGGSGMPIAAARYTAATLPLQFKLDEAAPMRGAKRLSEVPILIVTARVSRTGEAMPQSGDLRGQSAPIGTDRSKVNVSIDSAQH
jgi:hypothetical protein